LKLHDLRVLISVVQAGSMSKAAERLGTAQPALSRSVTELEHALGVRLLDRSPRGVEPTAYGRALIKRGIAVFDEPRGFRLARRILQTADRRLRGQRGTAVRAAADRELHQRIVP